MLTLGKSHRSSGVDGTGIGDASVRMAYEFSDLIKVAIDGNYHTEFFGSAKTDQGYRRRLRAVVQNTLTAFDEEMKTRGRAKLIVDRAASEDWQISRSDYIKEVTELMKCSRGRELPGTFNPLVVGELFRDQCQPWTGLAHKHTEVIVQSAFTTINDVLTYVAVDDDADKIR